MTILLLGAPGSGKGTQGVAISAKIGIPVVSTGDMLRAAMKEGTEAGLKAESYIESGGLVPDEVVIEIVGMRLGNPDCENGYILDGFPRTIHQAEALIDAGLTVDKALFINVEDHIIEERMSGRRVCPDCGATYHIESKKPRKEGVCDKCARELIRRKDDAPETVQERLKTYHDQTEPLLKFYEDMGILYEVCGCNDVSETTSRVFQALGI
ncbi:MAG: adenylate kinase [Oscillospiraceae bacterium]|nr:adenylate kinase [Oscillospiraceae bacterium]